MSVVQELMDKRLRSSTRVTYKRNWKLFIAWLIAHHPSLVDGNELLDYDNLQIDIIVSFLKDAFEQGRQSTTLGVRSSSPPPPPPSSAWPLPSPFAILLMPQLQQRAQIFIHLFLLAISLTILTGVSLRHALGLPQQEEALPSQGGGRRHPRRLSRCLGDHGRRASPGGIGSCDERQGGYALQDVRDALRVLHQEGGLALLGLLDVELEPDGSHQHCRRAPP